jgi:hypothetical protein
MHWRDARHPYEWGRGPTRCHRRVIAVAYGSIIPTREDAVEEYRMTWSDAIRVETDFLETQPMHHRSEDAGPPDAVGPALGRERSLTWILGLAAVRADEARKIISNLHAAFHPVISERTAEPAAVPLDD